MDWWMKRKKRLLKLAFKRFPLLLPSSSSPFFHLLCWFFFFFFFSYCSIYTISINIQCQQPPVKCLMADLRDV